MTFKEFKRIYMRVSYKDKVLHKCRICGKEILFTRDQIRNHLSNEHELGMDAYEETRYDAQYLEKLVDKYQDRQPVQPIVTKNDSHFRYSDVYKDYSVYMCQEVDCDYTGFYGAMYHHMKKSHNMDSGQYLAKHGKHLFKDRIRHICKMCDKEFLYNNGILSDHLKLHGVTVENYAVQYLDTRVDLKHQKKVMNSYEDDESPFRYSDVYKAGIYIVHFDHFPPYIHAMSPS